MGYILTVHLLFPELSDCHVVSWMIAEIWLWTFWQQTVAKYTTLLVVYIFIFIEYTLFFISLIIQAPRSNSSHALFNSAAKHKETYITGYHLSPAYCMFHVLSVISFETLPEQIEWKIVGG